MSSHTTVFLKIIYQSFRNRTLKLKDLISIFYIIYNFTFRCFERFFKAVNSKEGKLKVKKRMFLMDDVDLIGNEYVWRVSIFSITVLSLVFIEIHLMRFQICTGCNI